MNNGAKVAAFEQAFAEYVGAKYAIALCNGTATLHTALAAMGAGRGEEIVVPPLTMSATTLAVLHAGCRPVFADVDKHTWLLTLPEGCGIAIPVSLYGLHWAGNGVLDIDDAAQTLRPHSDCAFTSYSFQASKIIPLGEGGMLVTDNPELATRAREFSSLGYRMAADQPRIDPAVLKSPSYERHHTVGWNYRMSDLVADAGLRYFRDIITRAGTAQRKADWVKANRQAAANMYRDAITGCVWVTPQRVPQGSRHDYWAYTIAVDHKSQWQVLADAIERRGGERPYAAWRLTYQEPALRHLCEDGLCPNAESLQPRLMQFQTNDLASAERNAEALRGAIREIGG